MDNITNSLVACFLSIYETIIFLYADSEREHKIIIYEKCLFFCRHLVLCLEILYKYVGTGGTDYPLISGKLIRHISNVSFTTVHVMA